MRKKKPMARKKQRMGRPSSGLVTPRQHEILELVVQGLTNREIGSALDIGTRTVEIHRYNFMTRLGVHNVAQLIQVALKKKLVTKRAFLRAA